MDKIVEVYSFTFSFKLPIEHKDNSFSIHKFNYGGGSLYQKFKNKVNSNLYDSLKSLKYVDLYIKENLSDNNFSFIVMTENEYQAHNVARIMLDICKNVHNIEIEERIPVEFVRSALVQTTSEFFI